MLELSKYRFSKEIILDDRKLPTNTGVPIQVGYKPDKSTIQEIGQLLPNCKILGFRKYYQTVWSVWVTDPRFLDENFITMTSLKRMTPSPGFMRLLP